MEYHAPLGRFTPHFIAAHGAPICATITYARLPPRLSPMICCSGQQQGQKVQKATQPSAIIGTFSTIAPYAITTATRRAYHYAAAASLVIIEYGITLEETSSRARATRLPAPPRQDCRGALKCSSASQHSAGRSAISDFISVTTWRMQIA